MAFHRSISYKAESRYMAKVKRTSCIVIVRDGLAERAFGLYRSFKKAEADAKAWGGYVLPLEPKDASEPWNPRR